MMMLMKLGAYLLVTYGICALVGVVAYGLTYGIGVAPEFPNPGPLVFTLILSGIAGFLAGLALCIEKPWE